MYKLRTRPFAKHQYDAISWLAERERGAVLLPMGLGKTYIVLARMSLVEGPTLVISPLSVVRGWKNEIRKHTTASCSVAIGEPSARRAALESDTDFVIINYDYFSRLNKSSGAIFARFPNVVLDESTRIKNPRAKRTKSILRLFEKAKRKYILTGTPITKDYTDVFSQWLFIDDGRCFGTNYFYFLRQYYNPVDFGGGRRGWAIKHGGPEAISTRLAGSYFYRSQEDCVDLPATIYERKYYRLGADQRKIYDATIKEWIAEFEGGERVVNNALARDTLLRQICSGYLGDGDGGVLRELDTTKYEVVREIVADLGEEEQVLVWFQFRHEKERLLRALKEFNPVYVDGSVASSTREDLFDGFERRDIRIFLAQIQSCAYGINAFAKCRYSIYVGHSYDLDLRAQSEKRTNRHGSEASCTYIDVVGEKTIEEAILEVLATKAKMPLRVFKQSVYDMVKRWAA